MIIKCLKEKKQSLIFGTCIFCFAMIGPFFSGIDIESKIGLSVLALFIYIICLPVFLSPLQWYIISEESIVVRNVFRVVNRVDFENVKLIYKKRLPIFTRDAGIDCLLFQDNRQERIGIFKGGNVDNNKKCLVRIPYSNEVFEFIKKNHLELKCSVDDTTAC